MSNASIIEQVLSGDRSVGVYRSVSGWSANPPSNLLMLAGSFRPLHRGHRSLLNVGWEITGKRLMQCFEISFLNVEKPEIVNTELERRLKQFHLDGDIVVITRAATFLEKARLMPGTTFAIGYDTAVRLFDDRFYEETDGGSPTVRAMKELRDLGSSFVVAGRHDDQGEFRTVADLDIPTGLESLLVEIPEAMFSDPISSTLLRRGEGEQ